MEQYDGAPAVKDALAIMIQCYDKLGLQPLAAQAREVYEANYSAEVAQSQAATKRAWWKFW